MKKSLVFLVLLVIFTSQNVLFAYEKDRQVLYIHDIHRNHAAQTHVSDLLKGLYEKNSVDLVTLEGATGPITLSRLRNTPYQTSIEAMADYYLKGHKISGPVHAALKAKGAIPPVIGIEDPRLYHSHTLSYAKAAALRPQQMAHLKHLQFDLQETKNRVFNKELREFDALVMTYREGSLPLDQYVQRLHQQSPVAVGSQLNLFLEAPDRPEAVEPKEVIREIQKKEEGIFQTLAQNTEERDLVQKSDYLYLVGKLMNFSLSPDEWKRYQQIPLPRFNIPFKELDSFEDFYRYAKKRDQAMATRFLQAIKKTQAQTIVLVTGGFHSEGLHKELAESQLTLTPYVPPIQSQDHTLASHPADLSLFGLRVALHHKSQGGQEKIQTILRNLKDPMARRLSSSDKIFWFLILAGVMVLGEMNLLGDASELGLIGMGSIRTNLLRHFYSWFSFTRKWFARRSQFIDFYSTIDDPAHFGPSKYHSLLTTKWEAVKILARGGQVQVKPDYVEIHPSEPCDNDCEWCHIPRLVPERPEYMKKEHLEKLIDGVYALNPDAFIRFSGIIGEPILHPNFVDALKRVNQYGLQWGITTDGVRYNEQDNPGILKASKTATFIHFSVDVGTEESYQELKMRKPYDPDRPPRLKKVLKNLETLVKFRRARGLKMKIVASFVVSEKNYPEISLLSQKLKPLGIDEFQVKMQHYHPDLAMTELQVTEAFRLFDETKKRDQTKTYRVVRVQDEAEVLRKMKETSDAINFRRCSSHQLGVVVAHPRGPLYACCEYYNPVLPPVGHIGRQSLEEVWTGDHRLNVLQMDPRDICKECSPSDLFVNRFMEFLTQAQEEDPTFLDWVEKNFVRPFQKRQKKRRKKGLLPLLLALALWNPWLAEASEPPQPFAQISIEVKQSYPVVPMDFSHYRQVSQNS